MRVELYGGPHDGEQMEVRDGQQILRVALFQGLSLVPSDAPLYRIGIYQRALLPQFFVWRGEE